MQNPGEYEGIGNAEDLRHAEKLRFTVEIEILAGVNDVESRRPCGDCCSEPENSRIERAADCNPGGRRRDSQRESQHDMVEMRETFGKRVGEDNRQCQRCKLQAEPIQFPRREKKYQTAGNRESPTEAARQQARRNMAR